MPLRVPPQLAELGVLLRQGGAKATAAARNRIKKEAQAIMTLARSNCPVLRHDETTSYRAKQESGWGPGPLERSIVVEKGYEDTGRLQMLVNCGGIDDTDRYALLMEEGLSPYGSGSAGKLGPESQKKAGGGNAVGGKFMERAYNSRVDKIPENIIADIKSALEES